MRGRSLGAVIHAARKQVAILARTFQIPKKYSLLFLQLPAARDVLRGRIRLMDTLPQRLQTLLLNYL